MTNLYKISMLALIATGGLIIWASYSMFYPFKTVTFNRIPAEVTTNVVNAGESMTYQLDYCHYTDVSVEITRQFVDGVIYSTPSFRQKVSKGCDIHNIELPVPSTLNSGTYHLRIFVEFDVNPLRKITKEFETTKFKVIGKDEQTREEDLAKIQLLLVEEE